MYDWPREKVKQFLELYESESVLWDTTRERFNYRYKAQEAWKRISENMGGISVDELKEKKKSLVSTFRVLIKKKIKSIKSGASEDDVFHPTWFAYYIMERFLGKLYYDEDTEEVSHGVTKSPLSVINDESSDTSSSIHQLYNKSVSKQGSRKRLRTEDPLLDVEEQIPINKNTFVNKPERRSRNIDPFIVKEEQGDNVSHVTENSADVCEAYANFLAKRLRRYPERMRDKIMYKIDGLLLENPYPEESSSAVSQSQLLSY